MTKGTKYHGEVMAIFETHFAPHLSKTCSQFSIAGDLRRHVPQVSELTIVAVPRPECLAEMQTLGNGWGKRVKGEKDGIKLSNPGGFKVHIHFASTRNYGLKLARLTGSAHYWQSILMALRAHGITDTEERLLKDGQEVETPTEETVFKLAGMEMVRPERRA